MSYPEYQAVYAEIESNLRKHMAEFKKLGIRIKGTIAHGEASVFFMQDKNIVDAIEFRIDDAAISDQGFAKMHEYMDECIADVIKGLSEEETPYS